MTTIKPTPKVPANTRGDALLATLATLTDDDLPHLTQAQQHELADHGAISGYWNNGRPGWTWTINKPDIDRHTTN